MKTGLKSNEEANGSFSQKLFDRNEAFSPTKKPNEIDKIEPPPEAKQNQVVIATRAHHGKEAPKGESGQAQPEGHPVKSEEAEKAERCRGDKTADLWRIDGIEIEILDFGPYEGAFAQGLV